MDEVSESHPLRQLFLEMVKDHFDREIGLRDPGLQQYVTDVLTEFCDCKHLYKIKDAAGNPLHDVGEMLLEADPVFGNAPSFDREREVRKHVGDYTLFFTGMYPESITRSRLRRLRLDSFVDLMKAGKESYYIVSKFDQFEYQRVAPLFAKLANEFESCVVGLNMVKSDLQEMKYSIFREPNDLIM